MKKCKDKEKGIFSPETTKWLEEHASEKIRKIKYSAMDVLSAAEWRTSGIALALDLDMDLVSNYLTGSKYNWWDELGWEDRAKLRAKLWL